MNQQTVKRMALKRAPFFYSAISSSSYPLHENAKVNYSSNKINKVFDGIYTRVFTDSDIEKSKKGDIIC